MLAVLGALLAGALTTLAPCVLPLLPVIVGGSIAAGDQGEARGFRSRSGAHFGSVAGSGSAVVAPPTRRAVRAPVIIATSLGMSIVLFTLLLKATTALLGVPTAVWEVVSGGLLIALGLVALFPQLWERISARLALQARSSASLGAAQRTDGTAGLVLTGAALGPVFTSCSPLYGYVIVTVLPAEPAFGLVLLTAYVVGLCGTLLGIALLGQRAVRGARWAADPSGWFRRGLGAVFVVIGVLVLTGWMKDLETWLIANSPVRPWNLDGGFLAR